MKFKILCSILAFLIVVPCIAFGETMVESPESIAETVARKQFVKDQPKADLKNFEIKIEDKGDAFRVNICPKLPEGEPLSFGGENKYGKK